MLYSKPSVPIWQPAAAARLLPGCRGAWLLAERSGSPGNLAPGVGAGALILGGSPLPTWTAGVYGPALAGGGTNPNGAKLTAVVAVPIQYPIWQAVLYETTGTAQQCLGGFFAPNNWVLYTASGGAQLQSFTGSSSYSQSGRPVADGRPHVAAIVVLSATVAKFYFDGSDVGGATVPTLSAPFTQFTLGADTSVPFQGRWHAAAIGSGAAPDMGRLAADWLAGTFAAARPRRTTLFAPSGGWIRRLICCGD